jgi:hypothetical protein
MPPQPPAHPLRTAATVIYATFALLIATIPQSLPNWVRDKETNPALTALLAIADVVEAVSHGARLDVAYRSARGVFLEWTGKGEN